MMKRTTIIIILISFGVVSVVGFFVYQNSNKPPQYTETTKKEPELGSGRSVPLKNTAGLSDVLLPKQVQTLNTMLDEFLLEYLDPNISGGGIIVGPTVNQDGSVIFTVEATAPEGKSYSLTRANPDSSYVSGTTVTGNSKAKVVFTVEVFRDSYTSLTIKINEYNYTSVKPLSN